MTGPAVEPPTGPRAPDGSPIGPPIRPPSSSDTPTPETSADTSPASTTVTAEPGRGRGVSVRLRITLAVAALTACAVVLVAVLAPGQVESTLEDDLLDARAVAAADLLEFDFGNVVVGDDLFTTDSFLPGDVVINLDAIPGLDELELELPEILDVLGQLADLAPDDLLPDDIATGDLVPNELLPDELADLLPTDLFPDGLLPDDIDIADLFPDDLFPGDLVDVTLGDVGFESSSADQLTIVGDRIQLATDAGVIDPLLDVADGSFAVAVDTNASVTVERDDAGVVQTGTVEAGDPRDLGVPVMLLSDLDSYLFDDLALVQISDGAFVDSANEAGRTIVGVRQVDGTDFLVSDDASAVDRTVDTVRRLLWLGTPLLVLLVGGAAWLLTGRALRPVKSITDQAATISGGTLDARVPVPTTGDEIATLATTVNGMLDRLETDDRRRRQFVSDASHELRTPVAVLRSEAEVALRHPESTRVDELAESVAAESSRMSVVIDDLLALARHDEGARLGLVDVDLDDLLLTDAARSRRVPVTTPGVSAARVRGDAAELSRMIGHLLDNAARHADTSVVVTLTVSDGSARLVVDDDGPGVPPDRRELIFERFARLDDARTRDQGGAGLGLAVVRSIAERHGGTVGVDRAPLGGARFVVTLPAG